MPAPETQTQEKEEAMDEREVLKIILVAWTLDDLLDPIMYATDAEYHERLYRMMRSAAVAISERAKLGLMVNGPNPADPATMYQDALDAMRKHADGG